MKFKISQTAFEEIHSEPLDRMTSEEYDQLAENADEKIRRYQLQQREIIKQRFQKEGGECNGCRDYKV